MDLPLLEGISVCSVAEESHLLAFWRHTKNVGALSSFWAYGCFWIIKTVAVHSVSTQWDKISLSYFFNPYLRRESGNGVKGELSMFDYSRVWVETRWLVVCTRWAASMFSGSAATFAIFLVWVVLNWIKKESLQEILAFKKQAKKVMQ